MNQSYGGFGHEHVRKRSLGLVSAVYDTNTKNWFCMTHPFQVFFHDRG